MSRKWSLEIIFIIHFITELFFLHHSKIYLILQIELHKSVLFMFYPPRRSDKNLSELSVPVLEMVIDEKNSYLYSK